MEWVQKVVALTAVHIVISTSPASSQTLNDAVVNQLDFGPAFTQPCFELLDKGGRPAPNSSLEDICTRTAPLPGAGPSASAGGGAATPTTLPSIVQKRFREARGDESKSQAKEPAASTDAIVKMGGKLNIFYSGQYNGFDRSTTTLENAYHSDLWRMTADTGHKANNGISLRSKQKGFVISKASYPGAQAVSAGHKSDSRVLSQAKTVLRADSDATKPNLVSYEIAMSPLQITDVKIKEVTANSAIIQIDADQPVDSYNTFVLSDPPRIVIDIMGALFGEHMLRRKAGKGPIKQIRSSQYRRKPVPVVRVVLDLSDILPYQVAGLPDTFQLFIGKAVAEAAPVKPPVPPPVTTKKPKPDPEELKIATEPVQTFKHGMGFWGVGEYEDRDRDRTKYEDGYDSDIWRVTIGADYQFTERILAGLALDYYHHEGDYDGGGDFDNDSYGFLGYASFLPFDNWWAQAYGGYARKDYERTRSAALADTRSTTGENVLVVRGPLKGDYNGNEYSAGALAGYDFHIENVTISPRAGVDWVHREFDSYREKGKTTESRNNFIEPGDSTGLELRFQEDDQTLIQSRLGVQASVAFQTGFGAIVPQASFDWKHEFDNDQRTVDVSFVEDLNKTRFTYRTDEPESNWFELNAGVITALPNGLHLFGNYRTMIGHSFLDSHAGTIGIRFSF
jgi:outer membrane autotransporter protein